MQIKVFDSEKQDSYFYSIMGYHFASLEHKKELGGWQLYNKEGSIWFLIFDDNDNLVGFCGVFETKKYLNIDNFIILKDFRKKGYSKMLLDYVNKYFHDSTLRALVSEGFQQKIFINFGFKAIGIKGHFIIYERV